jgi:hypothetical protein
MNDAIHHFVLLVFAVGFSATGWFMARNPLRVYRAFTFGNNLGNKFLVGFCGIVGWCFAVVFAGGALMYAILVVHDLIR